jgi:hypothetical protein
MLFNGAERLAAASRSTVDHAAPSASAALWTPLPACFRTRMTAPHMTRSIRTLAVALAFALAAVAAQAQGYSPEAQRVLAQARAATGGAAWNSLRGWHEVGRKDGRRYEAWFDPLRYGMRVETHEPAGLDVRGFNGAGDWRVFPSGVKTGRDIRTLVTETRSEAFFGVRGYFYPGRFDAKAQYVGVRTWKGRSFEVVRVKPWAGFARELWFDKGTHLLGRMVDDEGPKPFAVEFSDYRRVGPVRVAFRIEGEGGEVREIERLDFQPADRALFSLPRPSEADAGSPARQGE